jgi:hypothetical protein
MGGKVMLNGTNADRSPAYSLRSEAPRGKPVQAYQTVVV